MYAFHLIGFRFCEHGSCWAFLASFVSFSADLRTVTCAVVSKIMYLASWLSTGRAMSNAIIGYAGHRPQVAVCMTAGSAASQFCYHLNSLASQITLESFIYCQIWQRLVSHLTIAVSRFVVCSPAAGRAVLGRDEAPRPRGVRAAPPHRARSTASCPGRLRPNFCEVMQHQFWRIHV